MAHVMDTLNRWLVTHQPLVRLAIGLALVVLAACNNANNSGGGPGY